MANQPTRVVTVRFDIEVPDSASDSEIEDWVGFYVGANCQLDGSNPMIDQDLKANYNSVRVQF